MPLRLDTKDINPIINKKCQSERNIKGNQIVRRKQRGEKVGKCSYEWRRKSGRENWREEVDGTDREKRKAENDIILAPYNVYTNCIEIKWNGRLGSRFIYVIF